MGEKEGALAGNAVSMYEVLYTRSTLLGCRIFINHARSGASTLKLGNKWGTS